jgi:hypothetical protein
MASRFLLGLPIVATLAWIVTFGVLNSDLIHHPYALELDQIQDLKTMDKLIGGKTLAQWVDRHFLSNYSTYHGQITLMIPALLSVIPRALFGEAARVFLYKMLSPLLLLISFWLFSFTFFRSNFWRTLAFFSFLALPFNAMWSVWPRVESYLFFFMALFFFVQVPKKFSSASAYLFAGIALVCRISFLPYLPFVLYLTWKERKEIKRSIAFLFLGIGLAQPQLLTPWGWSQFIQNKYFQMYQDVGRDQTITWKTWLLDYIEYYFSSPLYAFMFVAFAFLLAFTMWGRKKDLAFSLLVPALSSLLFVSFTIQIQDSPWYLQQHILFLLIVLFMGLEEMDQRMVGSFSKYAALTTCLLLVSLRVPFFPKYRSPYPVAKHWNYSKSDEFRQKLGTYEEVKRFLETLPQKDKPHLILASKELWELPATKLYQVTANWDVHLFANLSLDSTPDGLIMPLPDNEKERHFGDKEMWERGMMNYRRLVSKAFGGECTGRDCYDAVPISGELYYFFQADRKSGNQGVRDSGSQGNQKQASS